VQVALQIQAFSVNQQGANLLENTLQQAHFKLSGFPVLYGQSLKICDAIPNSLDTSKCTPVWLGTPYNASAADEAQKQLGNGTGAASASTPALLASSSSTAQATTSTTTSTSTVTEVVIPSGVVVQAALSSVSSVGPLPTKTVTEVVFVAPTSTASSANALVKVRLVYRSFAATIMR
jgi:hypothetical protein